MSEDHNNKILQDGHDFAEKYENFTENCALYVRINGHSIDAIITERLRPYDNLSKLKLKNI